MGCVVVVMTRMTLAALVLRHLRRYPELLNLLRKVLEVVLEAPLLPKNFVERRVHVVGVRAARQRVVHRHHAAKQPKREHHGRREGDLQELHVISACARAAQTRTREREKRKQLFLLGKFYYLPV